MSQQWHAPAIHHIRHSSADDRSCTDTDQCTVKYCNDVLQPTPSESYSLCRTMLLRSFSSHQDEPTPADWLPVQQRIDYKLTLLTFKIRSTSIPSYSRRERTSTTCETDQPLHCCADQNNNRKASNLLHGTSNLKLTAKDSCLIVTLSPLLNLS